jgi:hypothetical protein
LPLFKESDEISKVLRHNETGLDHGEFEHIVVGSASQLYLVD